MASSCNTSSLSLSQCVFLAGTHTHTRSGLAVQSFASNVFYSNNISIQHTSVTCTDLFHYSCNLSHYDVIKGAGTSLDSMATQHIPSSSLQITDELLRAENHLAIISYHGFVGDIFDPFIQNRLQQSRRPCDGWLPQAVTEERERVWSTGSAL